ncbi:hypothetical protein K490DRAFT_54109 [Saccharata proteae CBS 121410]|uniref:Uncharacterized protein n=1 Tax=Saccharata proteae CBS 121410 TaxID=1314787 RepID=A0A9P4I1V7_9PEZI|nr:hypothetical protein K490DRAFT_54109 [Saccharata proteae CBS 121410]
MSPSVTSYPVRQSSLSKNAVPAKSSRPTVSTIQSSKTLPPHARLHKRVNSASSVPSARSSLTPELSGNAFQRVSEEQSRRSIDGATRRLKPYLRKLSTKDHNSLDLSLPALDSDSPTGLGIRDYGMPPRTVSDVTFAHAGGRHRHQRSTSSGNSQYSNGSAGLRQAPTSYVHPMRQTPRPFTPPGTQSNSTSVHDEDYIAEAGDIMSEDEFMYRRQLFESSRRSGSFSTSAPAAPAPIHTHSTNSITRLGSQSTTSLSNLANRQRRDTMKTYESGTSPSSRTSLDKAFGWVRGRESPVDPASRAASIRAARMEFLEKEEAKERKQEKEALKKQEREDRKRFKLQNRQSEHDERHSLPSLSTLNEKVDTVPGWDYSSPERPLPAEIQPPGPGPRTRTSTGTNYHPKRRVKSRWATFMAWFRTRLLKLGCL